MKQPNLLNKECRAFVPFYKHLLLIHSSSTLSSNCSFFEQLATVPATCSHATSPYLLPLLSSWFHVSWLFSSQLLSLDLDAVPGVEVHLKTQCSDTMIHQRPKADWNDTCLGTVRLFTLCKGRSCLGDKRH